MSFKNSIYQYYHNVATNKIKLLKQTLADLKESGANETKSTAGDKHETALAMLQIEQSNNRTQLQEAIAQKVAFEKLINVTNITKIVNGSLVKTNKGYFYISVALGKAAVAGISVIAISPQSPLGKIFIGLCIDESAEVNGNIYKIENIL